MADIEKLDDEKDTTVEGNEGTGNADTQTADDNKSEGNSDEVDVRAEAQKIADKMLAKKMKGMPSKEELKAFKEWQESQKTAEQKQSEKEAEYQKTLSEKETLKNENMVLKANVNVEDADYVVFKVSKMDGDFEENLQNFLKENPKYLKQEKEQKDDNKPETTGVSVKRMDAQNLSGVKAILKAKHPELYDNK